MTKVTPVRLALVASWLNQYGGAERVLEVAHELFPDAPVFTSTYRAAAMPATYQTWDIRVTFFDQIPLADKRVLLPLYPAAFESFDLRGTTSSSASRVRSRTACVCRPARGISATV